MHLLYFYVQNKYTIHHLSYLRGNCTIGNLPLQRQSYHPLSHHYTCGHYTNVTSAQLVCLPHYHNFQLLFAIVRRWKLTVRNLYFFQLYQVSLHPLMTNLHRNFIILICWTSLPLLHTYHLQPHIPPRY